MLKKLRVFIIIFLLVLIYLPSFAKVQELKSRLKHTQTEIREVRERNTELEKEINLMKNSKEYLEIVARDKMGVVKKGETVLKIIREEEK